MLFTTIEQIKDYIPVNSQNKLEVLEPHITEAEFKYIQKYLGETLTGKLNDYVKTPGTGDEATALEKLLPFVRHPLANFAAMLSVPKNAVVATNSGFGVISSNNMVPASDAKLDKYAASFYESALIMVDALLLFLEKNETDYPDWKESEGYTKPAGIILDTYFRFNKHASRQITRVEYIEIVPIIKTAEITYVEPVLSFELCERIREELKAELSEEIKKLLRFLWPAVAELSIFDKYQLLPSKNRGDALLNLAVSYVRNNLDDYPEYAGSGLYDPEIGSTVYQNQDIGVFIAGHGK